MKLKKMMALVLCAATVAGLGLTGCGNNSSDNGTAADAGSAAKESSDAGSSSSDLDRKSVVRERV